MTTSDGTELARDYRSYAVTRRNVLVVSGVLLVGVALVSIAMGPTDIPIDRVVGILLQGPGSEATASTIVWQIRVPRVLAAILIGAGLALAGAVMQSVLNNPLGSPYTLGISHAAMFGAALSIIALDAGQVTVGGGLGITFANPYLVTIAAFIASLSSAGVILALAKYRGASPETMILTGIALGSLFTAGTTAMQYFASQNELASIVFWSFGDVGRATWQNLAILTVVLAPSVVYFLRHSWKYNALDAGDETAKGVGVDVEAVRNRGMLVASFITALGVSFVGIVGFVGLVVPHIVRKLVGNNKAHLLPITAMMGALLLLVSDTAARTALAPTVLPVGIVSSFVGAPFFIYLVIRGKEYWK
ncbi:MAG: iron complex transport system permease protein [Halobacteriales archaeon]|jgi:iron complex transport system permease protein